MTPKSIGTQLRNRRHAMGVGLKVIAPRAGISMSYLCQIETGQRNAPLNTLARVAQAVGAKIVLRQAAR